MNRKNVFLIITLMSFSGLLRAEESQEDTNEPRSQEEWTRPESEWLRRRMQGLPSDPNKTPTTPDVIEHKPNIKGPYRSFHRKRIYFGKDESGKHCYQSIWEHSDTNPDFKNVRLVVFHEASSWNPWAKDSFEIIGTYADTDKHALLKKSIAAKGGVWCPKLNAIVGGSRATGKNEGEQSICDRFVEYMKQPQQPSKFNK